MTTARKGTVQYTVSKRSADKFRGNKRQPAIGTTSKIQAPPCWRLPAALSASNLHHCPQQRVDTPTAVRACLRGERRRPSTTVRCAALHLTAHLCRQAFRLLLVVPSASRAMRPQLRLLPSTKAVDCGSARRVWRRRQLLKQTCRG